MNMKKVLLCSLCLLVCALGIIIPAVALPWVFLVLVVVWGVGGGVFVGFWCVFLFFFLVAFSVCLV